MTELSRYGKVLRRYKCYGNLELPTKESFKCSFEAVQFIDGAVREQCYFPDLSNSESNALVSHLRDGVAIESISGVTEDGQEVKLGRQILWTNINYRTTADTRAIIVTLIAAEMLVKPKGVDHRLSTLRFGITNFEFEGNIVREQKTEAGQQFDRAILSANLPFGEMRIERLPGYEEAIANLKALQDIEPTCEISLELPRNHDIRWTEKVVDVLCRILSLAKGTKIGWIYLDGYDTEGLKRFTLHRHAVTMPYAGESASVVGSLHPEDMKELIEKGNERFSQLDAEYDLGRVIDSYLEAKRPHSYLESKGLAAIQAMELLAGKYAKTHNLVYVIDQNEFNQKLNEIGNDVRKVLQVAFGEGHVTTICGERNEKLEGLNRRTLRQVLREIFHNFSISVSGPRLNALIDTRNALVHKGSFNTNDRVREYRQIISTMDRVLLKMLGYEGYILDCEHNWGRVKL